jgi:hypothetical protein
MASVVALAFGITPARVNVVNVVRCRSIERVWIERVWIEGLG